MKNFELFSLLHRQSVTYRTHDRCRGLWAMTRPGRLSLFLNHGRILHLPAHLSNLNSYEYNCKVRKWSQILNTLLHSFSPVCQQCSNQRKKSYRNHWLCDWYRNAATEKQSDKILPCPLRCTCVSVKYLEMTLHRVGHKHAQPTSDTFHHLSLGYFYRGGMRNDIFSRRGWWFRLRRSHPVSLFWWRSGLFCWQVRSLL